jgi:hypothetical protein
LEFVNFDLLLTGDGQVRVLESPAGQTSAPVALALTAPPEQVLTDFYTFMNTPQQKEDRLRELGGQLHRALFAGAINDLYRESLGRASARARGLRIRLRSDSSLHTQIPWEFAYDGQARQFLSSRSDVLLCRYLHVERGEKVLRASFPLRLVLASAEPAGLPPLSDESEVDAVAEALGDLVKSGNIQLHTLPHATRDGLARTLRESGAHLLHFIGHGDFVGGRGALALEDENGKLDLLPADDLGEIVDVQPALRVVIVNACNTAQGDPSRAFMGVAEQLVAHGVPAVIAMRYPILDRVAVLFAQHFYSSLASGQPVDVAISETRQHIGFSRGQGVGQFGVPVLFMRTPDGQLIDLREPIRQLRADLVRRVLQLSQNNEVLAEWKMLHDLLQRLKRDLSLFEDMVRGTREIETAGLKGLLALFGKPARPSPPWDELNLMWQHGRTIVNNELLLFASERMKHIGKPFSAQGDRYEGEEWAVSVARLTRLIGQDLAERSADSLLEHVSQLQIALNKHLSLANDEMVKVQAENDALFERVREALGQLAREDQAGQWGEIGRDLGELERLRLQLAEWTRLHDLLEELWWQYMAAQQLMLSASDVRDVALHWSQVRDRQLASVFDFARGITAIGQAFVEAADGVRGEAWVVELKAQSDALESAIARRDLQAAYQAVREFRQTLERQYIRADRGVMDSANSFGQLNRQFEVKVRSA